VPADGMTAPEPPPSPTSRAPSRPAGMAGHGAELMVRCLENEGVEWVFGVPGEECMGLLEALAASRIRFVTTRHEQGAAFMANVWGRLTGRAGVCLSTLGPGATNLVTAVADANVDHAPLVAIAGQASTRRLHKVSRQVIDLVGMFRPISKFSSRILEAETIPENIRRAFSAAQTPKFGASFLELPENIANAPVNEGFAPLAATSPALPDPCPRALRHAATLIASAREPVLLAGNGVIRAGASAALRAFADATRIPVANTFMAKGVLPFSHRMSLGSAGLQTRDYVNLGLHRADLVIAVGYDAVEYPPHFWNPDGACRILHLDVTPPEIDQHYAVCHGVIGNLEVTLGTLAALLPPRDRTGMRRLRQMLIQELRAHAQDDRLPLSPQRLIWELRSALPLDAIVVSDVGMHKMWLARLFRCEQPNTCLMSNGLASMGIALPGGIAAKLAHPERTVVVATGDGGFLMNVQELETAVRLGLSLIVLVWNDGGYGLIEWKQEREYGRARYCRFGNPDFVTLAQAFGGQGVRLNHPGELRPALTQAQQQGGLWIIDCPVDYGENRHLTATLGELVHPN